MAIPVSVFILTLNEQDNLPACLASVSWCDDIHVLDSYSSDGTVEIAINAGATVTQRKFDNWSAHQNWAVANIPFRYPWVLYIDADERVTNDMLESVGKSVANPKDNVAFRVLRRDFFMGGWLKHVQTSPYYIRLFRPERMRYERLVNPVSIPDGPVGQLGGTLDHYPFSKGIGHWFDKHNSYSAFEAQQIMTNRKNNRRFSIIRALTSKDFHERRFHQKELFYRLPFRPFIKFFLLYVLKRGFLDGLPGYTYATLQAIYEYMIVLKTRELESIGAASGSRTAISEKNTWKGASIAAVIAFLFCFTFSATFASPKVFWYSQPVLPGQSVLVCGSDLSNVKNVMLSEITNNVSEKTSNRNPVSITPLSVSSHSLVFTIPKTFNPSRYNAELVCNDGSSEHIYVNQPTANWIQGDNGDSASRGGEIRVFGTCLSVGAQTVPVFLLRNDITKRLSVTQSSKYDLTVKVPDATSAGVYRVQIGRSHPVDGVAPKLFTIKIERPDRNTTESVLLTPLEEGNDDTAQVIAALHRLAPDGGKLYLGKGTFNIAGELVIPPKVSIVGKGESNTFINWTASLQPRSLLHISHDFALTDLTINSPGLTSCILNDPKKLDAGNIKLLRVKLVNTNPDRSQSLRDNLPSIKVSGHNVQIRYCSIQGINMPIYLDHCTDSVVSNNSLEIGSGGSYFIAGSERLIFENNVVKGVTTRSGGGGINTLDNASYSQNIFFANNKLSNFNYGDAEGITSDGPGGQYEGTLLSATSSEVRLATEPDATKIPVIGAGLWILSGNGAGQMRQVTAFSGQTVTLESPLDIIPAAGDRITICPLQRNYVIYGNSITNTGNAIQFYGSSYNMIVDGNICTNSGPATNSGRWYRGGLQPSWYIHWLNNEFHGRCTPLKSAAKEFDGFTSFAAPIAGSDHIFLTAGIVMRHNLLADDYAIKLGIRDTLKLDTFPFCNSFLIEQNTIQRSDDAIQIKTRIDGVTIIHNNRQAIHKLL